MRNLKLAQQAQLIVEQGQIADRFTKAIEQLGAVDLKADPKLDVRLGGIYSLEAIVNESKDFHWPIMEVLCTYVREHAPPVKQEELPNERPAVSADIQAILTVLGNGIANTKRSANFLTSVAGHNQPAIRAI